MKTREKTLQIITDINALALRGITVFPGLLFHFDVGRKRSINSLKRAMDNNQDIFLVTQKELSVDMPGYNDLFKIGVLCKVRQILKIPNDGIRVLVEGISRANMLTLTEKNDYLTADVEIIPQSTFVPKTKRDIALLRQLQQIFIDYASIAPKINSDVVTSIMDSDDLHYICDYIAQNSPLSFERKQQLLEQLEPRRKAIVLTKMLSDEVEILNLEQDIQDKVKMQMDKNQHDYYLREQMKAISEELGEGDDPLTEASEYIRKIEALRLSSEAKQKLKKEAMRLSKMQSTSPESGVVRTYLDTCLDIPWSTTKSENTDIKRAEKLLNSDHFGMEKVKERILEFFAVKQLTGTVSGQILCLVGPPGVGKTSIARSIAAAMGRDYTRLSLGGVRDEADIRGHRKTYIGAMPGRIVNALIQAKSKNCLMLIDEIDKLGGDYKGDPTSAMLEVFDTEQNVAFRDHFIELPIDLSQVLFVTTANTLDTIPAPLRDRMEIIEVPGYTDEEKLEIAKKHLIPKQATKHGLCASAMKINENTIRSIIALYTRESGVRTLERTIAKLCRKTAKAIADSGVKQISITVKNLKDYLGTPIYRDELKSKTTESGVVNGLAWTSVGGEMLEVEVMSTTGSGKLEITGNLGDVMKESVKAAITYIRSRANHLGLANDFITKSDIHVHFPEGAVPKDGPSAGITTATAIISALIGEPVPSDIAMTGEITLRGRVLQIGGLREKTMAAVRQGVSTVIIPESNIADLDDIDQRVRQKLTFVPVSHMDQVAAFIFSSFKKQKELSAGQSTLLPNKKNIGAFKQ